MRKKKTECTRQMRKKEKVSGRTVESEENIEEKCIFRYKKRKREYIRQGRKTEREVRDDKAIGRLE